MASEPSALTHDPEDRYDTMYDFYEDIKDCVYDYAAGHSMPMVDVVQRLNRLTAERDALLADKARLNWLERQWREGVIAEICGTCDDVDRGLGMNWNLILDAITTQAKTIRAALDAARTAEDAP